MRTSDLTQLYIAKQESIKSYGEELTVYTPPLLIINVLKSPVSNNFDFASYGVDVDITYRLSDDKGELDHIKGIYGIWESSPALNDDGFYTDPDYLTITPVKKIGKHCIVDIKAQKML